MQVELERERYVVSLADESEQVRNVRAAGGRVVLGCRVRRAAILEEVAAPQQRAAVIRAYLHRANAAGRSWGRRREARSSFGIDPDATDERLRAVADRYPTFRVKQVPGPADGTDSNPPTS